MLGAIAGDIIGSRFEGDIGPARDFALFGGGCGFTDDSVCTLAIADALLGGCDFAATLRAFVRRHPDRGYGEMFLNWAMADGAVAYGSWGNGAPMRVAAVGWLARDEAETLERAAAQAVVSHDHPDAVAAAQAVALAVLFARSGMSRPEIQREIVERFGYDLAPDHVPVPGRFDFSAAGTVPPALAAALTARDWEDAVRTAVCLGGDTDTLACIAGAVAESLYGIPHHVAAAARNYLTEDLQAVLVRFELAVKTRTR